MVIGRENPDTVYVVTQQKDWLVVSGKLSISMQGWFLEISLNVGK